MATLVDLLGPSISVGMVSKAERRAAAATAGPVEGVVRAIAATPAWNVVVAATQAQADLLLAFGVPSWILGLL